MLRVPTAAQRDLALLVFAATLFALLSVRLELAETIAAWTRPYERWQLDELPGVLLFVVAGLAWYAWRRAREGRRLLSEVLAGQALLAEAAAENRKLAREAVSAQEDERRHLAREIHDELGQYVNAIKIDAVWLREIGARGAPDVRQGAESIVAMTDHVEGVVRDLVRRLRPAGLDELGLAAALEHCIDGWRRRLPHVAFAVAVDEAVSEVDEATGITLFRAAQEGLTNVARHAQATNVSIAVRRESGTADAAAEVVLSVHDDGVGPAPGGTRSGFGLTGIRERVEALAGHFELVPAGTRGFGFVARLPWRQAGAA